MRTLTGKQVVLTGEFKGQKRSDVKNYLVSLGINVVGAVQPGVDALIHGMSSGSKLEKAKALHIPVFTLDEFLHKVVEIRTDSAPISSAERTLNNLGFTDHGGEYWKPPIGEAPAHLTWGGEGFPPVGTHCLFYGVAVGWDERLTDGCEISILSEINRNGFIGRVFTTTIDQEFILDYSCVEGTFKPLKTDAKLAHDIAVNELAHDIAVNELVDLMKNADLTSDQVDGSYVICAELLVDAGYRKHASLNRDFSKGDTKYMDINHWTAGVNVSGHINAIECYSGTKEGAELLRDEILARLS